MDEIKDIAKAVNQYRMLDTTLPTVCPMCGSKFEYNPMACVYSCVDTFLHVTIAEELVVRSGLRLA